MGQKRAGRPTKLTPELQKQYCELIALGVPRTHAARAVGIGVSTLMRWLADGEKQTRGRYKEFREAVESAEGACVAVYLDVIKSAAMGIGQKDGIPQWAAAAWVLERRFAQWFGRKSEIKIDAPKEVDAMTEAEHLAMHNRARLVYGRQPISLAAFRRKMNRSAVKVAKEDAEAKPRKGRKVS